MEAIDVTNNADTVEYVEAWEILKLLMSVFGSSSCELEFWS